MSKRRPAEYQIMKVYRCTLCGETAEMEAVYRVADCFCGGTMVETGESYPGDPQEWDEVYEFGAWRNEADR